MSVKTFISQANPNGFKNYSNQIEKKIKQTIGIAGNLVRNSAVSSIQAGAKSGIRYGKHQSSAPGQPPATDTGFLQSNIVLNIHARAIL